MSTPRTLQPSSAKADDPVIAEIGCCDAVLKRVMAGHSPSKTGVNALLTRPSTSRAPQRGAGPRGARPWQSFQLCEIAPFLSDQRCAVKE
jgi:hypothetical protein